MKALSGVDADTDQAEPRDDVESFVGLVPGKARLGCWYEVTLGGGTDVHVEGPGRLGPARISVLCMWAVSV